MAAIAFHGRPPRRHSRQHGFSLIELLVVLVVIGIALGMVAVQLMPDKRAALRDEAQRLALLLENAEMESQASGHPLAWSPLRNGYLFLKKNGYGEWTRLEDDGILRPRSFPDGIELAAVTVEEEPLKMGEILSLSSFSYAPPFRIRLSSGEASASVIGNSTGEVSVRMENNGS